MLQVRGTTRRPCSGAARAVLGVVLGTVAMVATAEASSLDGAGRLVVLPLAVSGPQRESTIVLTNPSPLKIVVESMYIGADGTPFASSKVGPVYCALVSVAPGESRVLSLSALCPAVTTTDIENFGFVQFGVHGGFDAAPFLVTSSVSSVRGGLFVVEGLPAGGLDPGRNPGLRHATLRVIGLSGEVSGGRPIDTMAHCYVGTLGEQKNVTLQLMEHGGGAAKPVGNPLQVSLQEFSMVKLSHVLAAAGLPPDSYENLSAEFYGDPSPVAGFDDGAAVIAACSMETVDTGAEDFRLARTPEPRDASRSRGEVVADNGLSVGPFQAVGPFNIAYALRRNNKAAISFYLRHEDRLRCRLVPSRFAPNEDPSPWQELRVLDPDGRVVAGGDNVSDTGLFHTGLKNQVAHGESGRWTVEVSWRETAPGQYPPNGLSARAQTAFGLSCEASNGLSSPLPLGEGSDDF